jgi:anti-sigma-K factor RskA
MSTNPHEAVSARLDEYALGQLSAAERREIEAHARECAACASEIQELSLVMQGLARAPEPVVPPPQLRARVIDAFTRESRAAAPARGASWRNWLAAAAALVIVLGGALFVVVDRNRRIDADLVRARAEAAELRARLDEFAGQTDLALSILTASDMRRIELAGSAAWSDSAARAYWSPTRGLLVVADRLPQPPPGRIYQVWVIGGSTPASAGLLGSRTAGRGMLIAPPPGGTPAGTVTVAITDEPPGGLPAPSGTIRLSGSL